MRTGSAGRPAVTYAGIGADRINQVDGNRADHSGSPAACREHVSCRQTDATTYESQLRARQRGESRPPASLLARIIGEAALAQTKKVQPQESRVSCGCKKNLTP